MAKKMKLYIFDYVTPVSDSYHDGGGVVMVCPEFGFNQAWIDENPEYPDTLKGETPNVVLDMPQGTPEFIRVFADEGCC